MAWCLVYLLAFKTHHVFQIRVIHQIFDQNWDLKGYRDMFNKILEAMKLEALPASVKLGE